VLRDSHLGNTQVTVSNICTVLRDSHLGNTQVTVSDICTVLRDSHLGNTQVTVSNICTVLRDSHLGNTQVTVDELQSFSCNVSDNIFTAVFLCRHRKLVCYSSVLAFPIEATFFIAVRTVSSSLRNLMDTTGLQSASHSNMKGMAVGRLRLVIASSDNPERQRLPL